MGELDVLGGHEMYLLGEGVSEGIDEAEEWEGLKC